MKRRFFISYRNADARLARAIQLAVDKRGVDIFDPVTIAPGADWRETLKAAIEDAAGMLVLVSSPTSLSQWQQYEIGVADALDKPIFVVGTENLEAEGFPAELSDKSVISLSRNDEKAIEAAADRIATLAFAA